MTLSESNNSKKVLITGSAGFIGMHTALKFLENGFQVMGLDNINTYYSVDLKLARLKVQGIDTNQIEYNKAILGQKGIEFIQLDITDEYLLEELFKKKQFDYVVHLAAQAGVRYSIENPHAYIDSNVKGFLNILEVCNKYKIKHLIYASSSSVYGLNDKVPFSEADQTDHQVSLYAASKKANEAMAHSYASVHGLPITGLRFFTVYGAYGRPDMALFKFTKNIIQGIPIDVYNHGNLSRDFTYVADIVEGVIQLAIHIPQGNIPNALFNIGNGQPVKLLEFIRCIEAELGMSAQINFMEMQPGDVEKTYANTNRLKQAINYAPSTSLSTGVKSFIHWYKDFYKV